MKITIVGAGRVGLHLAKYFVEEQQDVFLVDVDRRNMASIEADFNLRTFAGHPTDFNTLRDAGAGDADIFVAVTANTAENLVACALAKSMGARKTIARVDKYSYLEATNTAVVNRMGVDHVVFPDFFAARAIISALDHPWCKGWNEFNDGAIVMAAVTVHDASPIVGKHLRDLRDESRFMHVSALRRNYTTIIPGGNDSIASGDTLYITTLPSGVADVMRVTGHSASQVRKVIMMGGSSVTEIVARAAAQRFNFVIIEKDIDRCRQLTETCPDSEIIFGDAGEYDVLEEAGIRKCEAFVATSDNTESNILACLTASDLGVYRTVAEVEKEQLIDKAESFHIGSVINKPIITANAIFQLILDADASSSKCFALNDAEVARMVIRSDSELVGRPVRELRLPRELTLAGLVRDGQGIIVNGDTQLQAGDTVIVFCLYGALNKVEKVFKK